MSTWFDLPGRRAIGPIVVLWCRAAAGTPEVLAPDARSTALGSTGAASADDASATQHNPARLQAIARASFVLGLSGAFAHQDAPLLGPNDKSTSDIFGIFGMLGGAYRLSPRFVLGLSVLPASGSAGRYELSNGMEASAGLWSAEAQLALSFALLDHLWLGITYRASYVQQEIKTPSALPDGAAFQSSVSLDTFNFAGAAAGIYYEPVRNTGIGFAYRSRMSHRLTGTAHTPQGNFPAESHFASPDKFNLAISQRLFDRAVLASIQGGLAMSPWTVPHDRTYWEAKLGVEYSVDERWALRMGLMLGNENTRRGYASPFSSPPADLTVTPNLGAGARFGHWMLDGAGGLQFERGSYVESTANGFSGNYRARSFIGMLTLRYAH